MYNFYAKSTIAKFGRGDPYKNGVSIVLVDLNNPVLVDSQIVKLIDQNHMWKAINSAKVVQTSGKLSIRINTTNTAQEYNRAILKTQIDIAKRPVILSLDYASKSISGKAIFYIN
jgi:hypothetical protein